jgi:hypothetical protein
MNLTSAFIKTYEWLNGPGKIGPHEGSIAQRMLDGSKPVCNLSFPIEREEIQTLLNAAKVGTLSVFRFEAKYTFDNGSQVDSYYFCQKGKEKDMMSLHHHFDLEGPSDSYEEWENRAKDVGTILGYTPDDVNMYLNWCNSPMLQI